MLIKRILKILGFIFVPLLPMAVAIYFLFPYLNEEQYKEVTEKYSDDFVIGDTTNVDLSSFSSTSVEETEDSLKEKTSDFKQNIANLQKKVDSLTTVNESLEEQLANIEAERIELSDEKFSENIKSLLDLDVENLEPILSKMSDDQLIRIFQAGSGLERKKILRSLESDRAAKLMREVL